MRKLSKWKQKYLSFGGRVTLIKLVLNSILIFFFLLFQDVEESGGQTSGAVEAVFVGWKLRPEEDCLGELGYSLSTIEEREFGYKGFMDV